MFILDAHLDLAMNAMEWNRDLRTPLADINEREAGMTDKPDRGRATVSFPALRQGGVGLVVATLIARVVERGSKLPGWHSPEQAWAQTQGQLEWYRAMESDAEMRTIIHRRSLHEHLTKWRNANGFRSRLPIGYVLSLEGADSLVTLYHLESMYDQGLRALGPAHYGPGRYASGTGTEEGFTQMGFELLESMDEFGMILDVTHLTDLGFRQAMDRYKGPVWASHHNCRALVPHQRQLSDEQIRELLDRDAVIGVALDAWMLVPGWERGVSTPESTGCNLQRVADHIDHICQMAGHARQVGIGSDLDGAFGREQCPFDLESIADLGKLAGILTDRGYSREDIDGIMYANFLRFLMEALPDE